MKIQWMRFLLNEVDIQRKRIEELESSLSAILALPEAKTGIEADADSLYWPEGYNDGLAEAKKIVQQVACATRQREETS